MQSLLESVGLGGLVPSSVNVPAAPNVNLRNNTRNNNARRRLNFGAQHPPGNEPEMVEENIAIESGPNEMNVEAVEVMSPPGNEPTVGGRRRKASRKSRKASRKASRKSRKASRKASRKSRKASRKTSRKSRKASRN